MIHFSIWICYLFIVGKNLTALTDWFFFLTARGLLFHFLFFSFTTWSRPFLERGLHFFRVYRVFFSLFLLNFTVDQVFCKHPSMVRKCMKRSGKHKRFVFYFSFFSIYFPAPLGDFFFFREIEAILLARQYKNYGLFMEPVKWWTLVMKIVY